MSHQDNSRCTIGNILWEGEALLTHPLLRLQGLCPYTLFKKDTDQFKAQLTRTFAAKPSQLPFTMVVTNLESDDGSKCKIYGSPKPEGEKDNRVGSEIHPCFSTHPRNQAFLFTVTDHTNKFSLGVIRVNALIVQ